MVERRLSVRPSVRLSHRSSAYGWFAAERPGRGQEISIDSWRRRSAATAPQHGAAALSSKYGQCHVDSRGTRLNTDLFDLSCSNVRTSETNWNKCCEKHYFISRIFYIVIDARKASESLKLESLSSTLYCRKQLKTARNFLRRFWRTPTANTHDLIVRTRFARRHQQHRVVT